MDILVLDCETTIENNGHPFTASNKLCTVQSYTAEGNPKVLDVEYSEHPYGDTIEHIRSDIQRADVLVLFNGKFDLHWLRRYGITEFQHKQIWDVQLAHYIISRQEARMPSLEFVCMEYDVPGKSNVVEKYWDHGIDTPNIPWEIVASYGARDTICTWNCFVHQMELLKDKPKMADLIWQDGQDLLALEEIEWNGIKWDTKRSIEHARVAQEELDRISTEIQESFGSRAEKVSEDVGPTRTGPELPSGRDSSTLQSGESEVDLGEILIDKLPHEGHNICEGDATGSSISGGRYPTINPGSNDHISALLYGGSIKCTISEEYTRFLKSGKSKPATRRVEHQWKFPQLVKPLQRSASKKAGSYSVAEDTLLNLKDFISKDARHLIRLVLSYREKSKLIGTYCLGVPDKITSMGWSDNVIHGNLNQTVTRTGRLSSSNPNQQNMAGDVKQFMVTRYASQG